MDSCEYNNELGSIKGVRFLCKETVGFSRAVLHGVSEQNCTYWIIVCDA